MDKPRSIEKVPGDDALVTETKAELITTSSPTQEKAILWKIDYHILPLMFVSYLLQYLDKTSLSYTAIMGLTKDTHLHGKDYSWAASAFYLGYLVASYPVSICFVKLPLAKFLAFSVFVFAVVCTYF